MSDTVSRDAITLVPYEALDKQTLRHLALEFISREGTDYGEHEIAPDVKIEQIIRLLHTGEAVITYCAKTETTSIVPARRLHDIPVGAFR